MRPSVRRWISSASAFFKSDRRLDFRVGSRGWAYILENDGVITKGDLDAAQALINKCRKDGSLPLDICAEDSKRSSDGIEDLDGSVDEEATSVLNYLHNAHNHYDPINFWDGLDVYIELAVEKGDLASLFAPVCRKYHVVRTNIGGWADLNCRASIMRRFAENERAGRTPILLNCGDHDPGGLHISDFLRSNFEDLSDAVGWSPENLVIDRFGLNADFIEANGLTWIDNLETGGGRRLDDPGHPDHRKPYVQDYLRQFGARKVEANALVVRPVEGRELLEKAILQYVPVTALATYAEKLEAARTELASEIQRRILELGENGSAC